jgi:hypothetical protein
VASTSHSAVHRLYGKPTRAALSSGKTMMYRLIHQLQKVVTALNSVILPLDKLHDAPW